MAPTSLPDDISVPTPVLSRKDIPLKYYYVDFGISTRFMPDEASKLVLGTEGLDRHVPELSNEVPYDPFKVDVFILGNLFDDLPFLLSRTRQVPLILELTPAPETYEHCHTNT
ncbi:hypothetical protein BD414DRAFT_578722 [Trametes punicea]|nr:hypothetical protein BD414DRAFT_578722 [Trametes punicea]